ncbi:MAG: glutathione S-transferase, partial [Thiomonas sp.]
SSAARAAADKLAFAAGELLRNGGDHLFGDWSIADTDLALMLRRLSLDAGLLPPSLAAYAERQWQRPSVQAWARLSTANH